MAKTYKEKLKDPRWQKKRLRILERDNFQCVHCGDKESTLHVHHRLYFNDKDPWEYLDHLLITICESCHKQFEWEKHQKAMLSYLYYIGLDEGDFFDYDLEYYHEDNLPEPKLLVDNLKFLLKMNCNG